MHSWKLGWPPVLPESKFLRKIFLNALWISGFIFDKERISKPTWYEFCRKTSFKHFDNYITLIFLNVQFQPPRYGIKFRLSRKLPTFITEFRHIYILIIAQKLVYWKNIAVPLKKMNRKIRHNKTLVPLPSGWKNNVAM